VLKDNIGKGEVEISQYVSLDLVKDTLTEAGIGDLNSLADKAQAAVTDTAWNNLWQLIAKSAATVLSGGKLNWVSLSLGLVEIVFQKLYGKKEL
jgi:hypothetical protein